MASPTHQFRHLTVAERIQLVEDLWDSIAEAEEVLELTEAQRVELDRRLAAHRAQPGSSIPWAVLRAELTEGA
ncbi:MAG: addiction module protein [Longimicrobiales bacterium]|nr:addiction module protein [Longimicrobiales bacterium]